MYNPRPKYVAVKEYIRRKTKTWINAPSSIFFFPFTPYFNHHIHTSIENTSEDVLWGEFIQMPFCSGCLQPQSLLAF